MYSISTSWNYWRAKSGQQIVEECIQIGLDKVELNFSLPIHLFHEIKEIVQKGQVQVTSLHNYCPLPMTECPDRTPDMFSLCSTNEEERNKAVEYTKKTMDAAVSVGAQAVVLHLGRVKMKDRFTPGLIALCDRGEASGQKAQKIRDKFWRKRRHKGARCFVQALKSLDELNDYAFATGISLGLETRYALTEMPTLDEFEQIFQEFRGGKLYYWHDVGHAMAKEHLGLESHDEYLRRLAPYLLGWHLHDIVGMHDHKAPASGNFDFKRLLPYLTAQTINVLEPHHPATMEEVKKGYEFLKREILAEGNSPLTQTGFRLSATTTSSSTLKRVPELGRPPRRGEGIR